MKVQILLLILFINTILLPQSKAFISINIDPDDLDQVTDFIHTIAINDHPQSIISNRKRSVFISVMKKTLFGTIQLVGVTFSLVGANLLSMHFVPAAPVLQNQQHERPEIVLPNQTKIDNIGNKYQEMCQIDYGCNKNLCWRTCNSTTVSGKKMWCYSSPTPRQFQNCANSNDCSLCWDCIEACHK